MTRALACLAACLLGSGCSYAFMQRVPDQHQRMEWVDCTSSRLAPIVDVGGAVVTAFDVLAVEAVERGAFAGESSQSGGDDQVSVEGRVFQVALIAGAAVYTASAIYGFRSASRCEQARQGAIERQLAEPPPPTPVASPAGCQSDAECKGGRRCLSGSCAWPLRDPLTPAASPGRAP